MRAADRPARRRDQPHPVASDAGNVDIPPSPPRRLSGAGPTGCCHRHCKCPSVCSGWGGLAVPRREQVNRYQSAGIYRRICGRRSGYAGRHCAPAQQYPFQPRIAPHRPDSGGLYSAGFPESGSSIQRPVGLAEKKPKRNVIDADTLGARDGLSIYAGYEEAV